LNKQQGKIQKLRFPEFEREWESIVGKKDDWAYIDEAGRFV